MMRLGRLVGSDLACREKAPRRSGGSPRGHAAALAISERGLPWPPLREIAARESSTRASIRPCRPAISRVPAGNPSAPELAARQEPRRRGRLPEEAMNEEQGRKRLKKKQDCDERYNDGAIRSAASEPARADQGGGPGSGAVLCGDSLGKA